MAARIWFGYYLGQTYGQTNIQQKVKEMRIVESQIAYRESEFKQFTNDFVAMNHFSQYSNFSRKNAYCDRYDE